MKPGDDDDVCCTLCRALRGAPSAAICSSWYWISGRPSHGSSAFGVACDEVAARLSATKSASPTQPPCAATLPQPAALCRCHRDGKLAWTTRAGEKESVAAAVWGWEEQWVWA